MCVGDQMVQLQALTVAVFAAKLVCCTFFQGTSPSVALQKNLQKTQHALGFFNRCLMLSRDNMTHFWSTQP
jgi:hypothetical protein